MRWLPSPPFQIYRSTAGSSLLYKYDLNLKDIATTKIEKAASPYYISLCGCCQFEKEGNTA